MRAAILAYLLSEDLEGDDLLKDRDVIGEAVARAQQPPPSLAYEIPKTVWAVPGWQQSQNGGQKR